MRVPFSWLQEVFGGKLGGVSPEEVSYILSRQGIAVDQISKPSKGLDLVVVGHLNDVQKHPHADRLTVCTVNTGDKTSRTVVCGAKNHKVGDFVLVALPGAALPNGTFIKEAALRGVTSQGMICSREELGLPKSENPAENEGVMILSGKQKSGTPAVEVLGLDDVVFELDVTPNRGDCFGVIGVARELAAGLQKTLDLPIPDFETDQQHRGEQEVDLKVVAEEECPFFTLQVVQGIKVGPSPDWMQQRLRLAGFRPINNVVDITNYILCETGQPLHAYDLSKVKNGQFTVRRAKADMPFKALDEKEYALSTSDLVICDEQRVLCLAGVMGGSDSGITNATVDIALEAAYFNPVSVRKTARRYGMHTESSHRFERGVDPLGVEYASKRAIELILKHAGGTLLGGLVKVGSAPFKSKSFNVDLRHYQKIIGASVTQEKAMETLKRLKIECETKSSNVIKVTPPSFRQDLTREIDIFEELARIIGYDQIPGTLPATSASQGIEKGGSWYGIQELKKECVQAGFSESILYAFSPLKFVELFLNPLLGQGKPVLIKNPLSEDMGALRTSAILNLLLNLRRNQRFGMASVALFEQATIFSESKESYPQKFLNEEQQRSDLRGVKELQTLAFLLSGTARLDANAELWDGQKIREFDFFDLKGRIESVFDQSCRLKIDWVKSRQPISFLHPAQQAEILMHKQVIGWAGSLHPALHEKLELDTKAVWIAEINLEVILQQIGKARYKFEMPSLFQRVERDAAFIVGAELPASQILESLKKVKSPLLKRTVIFDVFEGQGLGSGKKSIALRFTYQSPDTTLTDEQINEVFHECIQIVRTQCQAELRGSI